MLLFKFSSFRFLQLKFLANYCKIYNCFRGQWFNQMFSPVVLLEASFLKSQWSVSIGSGWKNCSNIRFVTSSDHCAWHQCFSTLVFAPSFVQIRPLCKYSSERNTSRYNNYVIGLFSFCFTWSSCCYCFLQFCHKLPLFTIYEVTKKKSSRNAG